MPNGVIFKLMLSFILVLLQFWSGISENALADSRPNIVLIVADDLGYADTGFTGAKDILTPHLDSLAKSGAIITNGYCNHPFCAPSRAALLAGRYQHRFGFEANPAHDPTNHYLGIDPNEKLFPKRLQKAGYKTGLIGKWHLGAAAPFHPNRRGFGYFYGFVGGGHDYFQTDTRRPFHNAYFQPLERNGQPAGFDGYLTDALSNDAVSFVESNKRNPFFLFLSYNAPHAPLQAPRDVIKKYSHIADAKRRIYAAMIDVMDQGIGRVMQALKQNGIHDNTIVFFMSDNGGPLPMSWNKNYGNGSSNAPFRGGKTNLYEGGVRVPFLVSWPGKIQPMSKFSSPVISIDIARTAVELAGADPTHGHELEGVNLVPFLTGQKTGHPHDAIYWRGRGGRRWAMVTSDREKLVVDKNDQSPELYSLSEDFSESNDLSNQRVKNVEVLKKRWANWNKENVAPRFENAPDYVRKREEFYQNSRIGNVTEGK